MGMNPVDSFLTSMNTTSKILRGREQDKREGLLYDMKMDMYGRELRKDKKADAIKEQKRMAAQKLVRLNSGQYSAADVAELDPDSGVSYADVFDEAKQDQAMGKLWPLFDRVAKGDSLTEIERKPVWAVGGALGRVGVLSRDLAGIKEQATVTPLLKKKIVTLSEMAKGQLLGKKTKIDEADDPELFSLFSKAFPAVANGSTVFKGGKARPVEFYIDATGVNKLQDARVVALLEGVDSKTGKVYRAPMSQRRSNDPNDPLAKTKLGTLYAQTDFAEKASKTVLASLAGVDDVTAQKILDKYYAHADEVAKIDRQRKLVNSFTENPAVTELVKGSQSLKLALQGVTAGTFDAKTFTQLAIKSAAKKYQKKQDEKTALATLEAFAQSGQILGGRTAKLARAALSGLQNGSYSSAKAALDANKELIKPATELDKEEIKARGKNTQDIDNMAKTLALQVIDGRLDPAMISKRGGLQQKVFTQIEQFAPGFNIVGANANAKYLTQSGNLQSRALAHGVAPLYDKLLAAGESLGNSDIPGVNRVVNWVKEQSGNPQITAFNNLRDDVVAETERVLMGSGVLSDSKYQRALHNLNSAQSFPQLQAAVEQLKLVVGSRLHALDMQPVQQTATLLPQTDGGNRPLEQQAAPPQAVIGGTGHPAVQEKTVEKTGRTPDGRKITVYTDGSWDYEN